MKIKLILPFVLFTVLFTNAQNVGIGILTPAARLHVADSNVLFTGPQAVPETTSYYPPVQGPGTRMMWYPQKAAFRVGNTNGDTWDFNKIAPYSMAFGFSTTASGNFSTAMGAGTVASGETSTAMGAGTLASGFNSMAMGYQSGASGIYSIAMGYQTHATGDYSTAIGAGPLASGYISTAMGAGTIASGNSSIATGNSTTATAFSSTAMGYLTSASGDYSTAMGFSTTARSYGEVTLGSYNTNYTPASTTSWNASDRLFVIGNGTLSISTSDAMVVLKNGNIGIGNSSPNALVQLGNSIVNRKIVLYDVNNNDNQYFGLGINGGMLRYQIDDVASQHGFYAGTAAGTSNWVFSMHGDGNAFCNGTLTESSDARLKKNIAPIGASLDKLMQINGYTYNWISPYKDQRQQIGLLAQDIQKLYPQLVTEIKGDNNESTLGLNYIGLIPVLIESIKEQQHLIDRQQLQIDELKKALEKLLNH